MSSGQQVQKPSPDDFDDFSSTQQSKDSKRMSIVAPTTRPRRQSIFVQYAEKNRQSVIEAEGSGPIDLDQFSDSVQTNSVERISISRPLSFAPKNRRSVVDPGIYSMDLDQMVGPPAPKITSRPESQGFNFSRPVSSSSKQSMNTKMNRMSVVEDPMDMYQMTSSAQMPLTEIVKPDLNGSVKKLQQASRYKQGPSKLGSLTDASAFGDMGSDFGIAKSTASSAKGLRVESSGAGGPLNITEAEVPGLKNIDPLVLERLQAYFNSLQPGSVTTVSVSPTQTFGKLSIHLMFLVSSAPPPPPPTPFIPGNNSIISPSSSAPPPPPPPPFIPGNNIIISPSSSAPPPPPPPPFIPGNNSIISPSSSAPPPPAPPPPPGMAGKC
jgi:hypothetical protein